MKLLARYLLAACVSLLMMVGRAPAEDIDIYSGGAQITGNKPNVLILLDNTANWNLTFAAEKDALKQAVTAVADGTFRLGVMMFTETGSPNTNTEGGYVRFAMRDMDAINKQNFRSLVDSLDINGDKSNGGKLGLTMYEVYEYFAGATSYSGAGKVKADPGAFTSGTIAGPTYRSPVGVGCQKNFLIYISNGPAQDNISDTTTATSFLSGLGGDTTTIRLSPNGSETNVGDEYSRFLARVADLNPSIADRQSLLTYTIDVLPGSTGQGPGWSALLESMATQGGGMRFQITDPTQVSAQLSAALAKIFLEIQSVNSVFTSASLPVSVNTQGTYLNQIYIGMFRPDAQSRPRWLGNLKEYKLARNALTGAVFLADSAGTAAVNSTTGFISPNAISFWTSAETTPATGYWKGLPFGAGGAGGNFNSPDGDIVEKGAAAQKLREQFGGTPTQTGAGDARKVFTCFPSCTVSQTPSVFATTNPDLMTRLQANPPVNISALWRGDGTDTAYAITSTAHGLAVGDRISIRGVSVASPGDTDPTLGTIPGSDYANYNGDFTVASIPGTPPSTTAFTYTVQTSPVTPGTGTNITAASGTPRVINVASLTFDPLSGLVTATAAGHGFTSGQLVTISGASPSDYNTPNGSSGYTISRIDADHFQYRPVLNPVETPPAINQTSPAVTNGVTCISGTSQTYNLQSILRAPGTTNNRVVVTTTASSGAKCKVGATVTISGVPGYNGSYSIVTTGSSCPILYGVTPVNNQSFCFDVSIATAPNVPTSPATGAISASGQVTHAVTQISRSFSTVTVKTADAHGYVLNQQVTINGANETEYNGTFPVTGVVDANTFTYSIRYQRPGGLFSTITSAAFGTMNGFWVPSARLTVTGAAANVTKGNSVSNTSLINWVRGQDVQDENNRGDIAPNGAGNTTEVRPSIHGDVLHSRPVVIDYGNKTDVNGVLIGQVAYYGANDGTFRAVKGGQAATDGVEKWSFVAPETFDSLQRLYTNDPLVRFFSTPSGISPPPRPRSYFADGSVGAYQTTDISKVYIYLSARRGGRFIYAVDVTNPDDPKYLWSINNTSQQGGASVFANLGQTWSTPKVAQVRGNTNPVLIFGAGYDPAEEDKAPGSARNVSMGYGVFIVDAFTGALVRYINPFGPTDTKYSFPSDITIVDTDFDGLADRLYVGDTGGNLWRMDIDDATPTNWAAYKLAALGGTGINDRKFLYPPEVVLTSDFAGVVTTSGNREYPIDTPDMRPGVTTVVNRAYMVKDTFTGKSAVGMTPVVHVAPGSASNTQVTVGGVSVDALAQADGVTPVDITLPRKGWFLTLPGSGEKGVNAPLSIAGVVFFGTNRPTAPRIDACTNNLGEARGYAVNVFTGTAAFDRNGNGTTEASDLSTVFAGGGLPPSPVAGTVTINGEPVRFIIGSGGVGSASTSGAGGAGGTTSGCTGAAAALGACSLEAVTTGPRKRTFWYMPAD